MRFAMLFVPYVRNPRKTKAKTNLAKYDLVVVLLYFHGSPLLLTLVPNKNNIVINKNKNLI